MRITEANREAINELCARVIEAAHGEKPPEYDYYGEIKNAAECNPYRRRNDREIENGDTAIAVEVSNFNLSDPDAPDWVLTEIRCYEPKHHEGCICWEKD